VNYTHPNARTRIRSLELSENALSKPSPPFEEEKSDFEDLESQERAGEQNGESKLGF